MSDIIAADQLRLLIERIERLEEEKKGISDDIKDVYGEAKSCGYDVKTIRECVKLRRLEKHVRDEREALLETYKAALGLDFVGTPLGAATIERAEYRPSTSEVLRRIVEAVNAGALGPGVTATVMSGDDDDALYSQAVALVREHDKASTSWLQRQLRIGYNSAACLVERMERENVVGAADHVGRREVLREMAEA